MKKNLVYIILFWCAFTAYSQQLPQFTQYMYNTISINPAYAGSRNALSIVGIHRNQWTGFDGAPETSTLSIHSPLRNDKIGLGVSFINDALGFENFTFLYGDFSYTIQTGVKTKLAFGLKGGFTRYSLDDELFLDPDVANDPFFQQPVNRWNPNFGLGLYFHSDEWYIGASSPRIINYDNNETEGDAFRALDRNSYYFLGGYVFPLSYSVKFRPSVLVKYTKGAPASVDMTATFLFHEKLWLGASYRFGDSVGAIADFQISPQLRLGYAYEYSVSDIRPFNSGTHEFLLIYEFKFSSSKLKSPRYF
ncbi:type IX secretion system membrane protein PorP/SprF [Leptobacterium flavescens]|uniref:Type IX secretion system membrane protein PorP/SprF n=1 Tax=Leptobacterium flavescens TaxID=472055 RepID=A0A6P0UPZ0_9FLAO|nr:type IX secretion system membrane protein PorP/SprF [Leptobacterium flavescens]NER14048.1 type IX secretion system membrane protein PorP/SprF [Leptobacterium flavescens]